MKQCVSGGTEKGGLARLAEQFPYRETVQCFRLVGKHFVDKAVLEMLLTIKQDLTSELAPYPCTLGSTRRLKSLKVLSDFLTIALDKYLGYYDYERKLDALFAKTK